MEHGRSTTFTRLSAAAFTGLATVLAGTALIACGSSSKSSSTTTTAATTSASKSASSGPGVGKPTVTLGDKNFAEENILGQLYAQALRAKGYTVNLKSEIGSTELIYKALKAGQIDGYPEYTGVLLSAVAEQKTSPSSEQQAYEQAKAFVEKDGFTLLEKTPFYDTNVLITQPKYASEHKLSNIGDLKPLNNKFTIGGAPELATREEGLPGIKKLYGVEGKFKPVSIELSYQAIEGGQVNVQSVFSTDGQLLGGKFKLLGDPKHVFGFQNVAPVMKKSVVAAEGPAFTETMNKVSALLTIPAMQQMNKAVSVDKQSPESVAKEFLSANGLA
ncbi:MAG TPA: glycine betaine ABC transporter substrate-binding protein [Solirubrobacteraceae bacterium]|jgi:osmoprotectant transport system substrate-binding protein|nr:glycine betaine ABC transporter substrate-binding protein [Solirubrobacteraceae bacterium]